MSKDMLAWLLLRGFLSPKESDSFINLMLTDLEESSPNGSFMCQNVLENLQRSGSLATDQTHRLVTILIDRWRRVPNVNQNLIEEAAKGGWIAGTDWLMLREALESIMKNPQWWGYGADRLLSTLPAEHQRHLVDLLLQLHGDRSRPNPYFWLHTAHSLGLVVDENFRKYIEQVVELKPVIGQPVDLTQGLSIALIGSDLRLVSDEWFFRAAIESISIDAIEVYNATGRSNDRIESPQWQWITDAWGRSFSCRFPAFIESSLLDTQAVRHELARDIELTIIWRIKAVADPDYELRIANLRNGITAGPLDDLTVHEWTYTWSHAVRLGSNRAIVQPLDTPEVKVRSMNCCAEPTAEGNWLMVGVRFTRIPCDLAFEVYAIADDTEYYVGDVAFPEGLEYLGLSVSALVPPLKSGVIEVELRPSDRVAKQSAGLTSYWPHVIRQEDIRVHWHGTNPPPGAR
ncbi:MAG: hypothetical protein KDA20_08715 [Phycisphaerales bacterium]|nr:hypothetical protein [Phycisphaerales bacterium]